VLVAIGNSADPALAGATERLLSDPAALVRGAAIWALGRLDRTRLHEMATIRRATESDPAVNAEWAASIEDAR
jgi:epoxyqueuosine reductase